MPYRRLVKILGSSWVSRPENLALLIPATVKLVLHLLAINGYGIHGDELYYLACSDHPDWGYVDHPALSIPLLGFERAVLGDSLLAIRLIPALAGFFTVLLAGLLARKMGAGVFGQFLAALCSLVAPVYLALNHFYSMNALDILFWLLAAYCVVGVIDGNPRYWVGCGAALGLGFENKIGVLFLGFGIALGLLLTQQRRLLLSHWSLVGAGIAVLLVLPYVIWQVVHGWPTLEWIAHARSQKMVALPPLSFLKEQMLLMQPLTIVIWGVGLVALFVYPSLARYRSLGWCYLIVLGVFILQGAKPYYLVPFYPVLFAAGSIVLEQWIARISLRTAVVIAMVVAGIVTAPLGMPLLPPDQFIKYEHTLGLRPNLGEKWAEGRMPAFFANFFGWGELVTVVDSVYQSLSNDDKKECGIFCQNYMEAGAMDFYGVKDGLPHAISGHNNYWLWGSRNYSGEVMIVVGSNAQRLRKYFDEVTERARFRNQYVQPMNSDLPIFVVRKPKYMLQQLWPKTKSYI